MKNGDIVTVEDSSYAWLVSKKGLIEIGCLGKESQWKILGLGCDLPADTHFTDGIRNDAIVVGLSSDRIVFTQERFLAPACSPKFCSYCGAKLKDCDC